MRDESKGRRKLEEIWTGLKSLLGRLLSLQRGTSGIKYLVLAPGDVMQALQNTLLVSLTFWTFSYQESKSSPID